MIYYIEVLTIQFFHYNLRKVGTGQNEKKSDYSSTSFSIIHIMMDFDVLNFNHLGGTLFSNNLHTF